MPNSPLLTEASKTEVIDKNPKKITAPEHEVSLEEGREEARLMVGECARMVDDMLEVNDEFTVELIQSAQDLVFLDGELSSIGVQSNADLDGTTSLFDIRQRLELEESPIWTQERLIVAIEGMRSYKEIYERASDPLKRYLRMPIIMQTFTGVRPVSSLATEYGKDYEYAKKGDIHPGAWDRDQLFLQVQDELTGLLSTTNSHVTVRKVDYTQVKYKGNSSFELMNEKALQIVARENPDLFDINNSDLSQWLQDNPQE